jgi:hypothetical protein
MLTETALVLGMVLDRRNRFRQHRVKSAVKDHEGEKCVMSRCAQLQAKRVLAARLNSFK